MFVKMGNLIVLYDTKVKHETLILYWCINDEHMIYVNSSQENERKPIPSPKNSGLWLICFKYIIISRWENSTLFARWIRCRLTRGTKNWFPWTDLCYVHNHNWSWYRFSVVFPNLMMSTCRLILEGMRVWIAMFNSMMWANYTCMYLS